VTDPSTLVVVNPVSAGGQTIRRWPRIRAALREAGVGIHAHLTLCPGDATAVTREEITHQGVRRVVVVGGVRRVAETDIPPGVQRPRAAPAP